MDNKFYTDNFERLLREKSDEFKMYPSKRVWHSVYNNLHPGRRWPSVTMCITLIASLLLVGYLNTDTSRQDSYHINSSKNLQTGNGKKELYSSFFKSNEDETRSGNFIQNNNQQIFVSGETFTSSVSKNSRDLSGNTKASSNTLVNTDYNISRSFSNSHKELYKQQLNQQLIAAAVSSASVNKALNQTKAQSKPLATNTLAETPATIAGNKVLENDRFQSTIIAESKETKLEDKSGLPAEATTTEQNSFVTDAAVENKKMKDVAQLQNKQDDKLKKNDEAAENKSSAGLTTAQKEWIENYALYNRPATKKWKGKLAWQAYVSPSVVYRNLNTNKAQKVILNNNSPLIVVSPDVNTNVEHTPFLGAEIGATLKYSLFKGIKLTAGLQLNYTSYKVHAFDNGHPISTALTLIDPATVLPYDVYRSTPYSNKYGSMSTNLYNQTFQFSVPLGVDFKIAGEDDFEWYAGATIQPTLLLGGKSYLISSDRLSYVKSTSFLNRFNMNAGFETFVTYKTNGGFKWQIGPEFRTQLFTTNSKAYSVGERLVNYGFKVGVIKNL